jgi:very-short-patch-repair endonuclease
MMHRESTDAEATMWRLLRDRRLVVEIDGIQHASSDRDVTRDAALAAEGFRTARYWNNDVLQRPKAVLEDILAKLAEP